MTQTFWESFANVRKLIPENVAHISGIFQNGQICQNSKNVTENPSFETQCFYNLVPIVKTGMVYARSKTDVVFCRMTGELYFVLISFTEKSGNLHALIWIEFQFSQPSQ